jgi:hypothetical protein
MLNDIGKGMWWLVIVVVIGNIAFWAFIIWAIYRLVMYFTGGE